MGIGGQEAVGRLVTVQTELPEGVDGILDAVRKIILLGEVQTLTLKEGEPITYQRFVRGDEELLPQESTQSFAELSVYDVVRNVRMEEWDPREIINKALSPHEVVVRMFLDMAVYGWVVTHLLLGESTRFWKWLEVARTAERLIEQFMGARIEKCKEVPEDVFILCGAKTRQATIAEIGFSMKGTIDEKRAGTEDS